MLPPRVYDTRTIDDSELGLPQPLNRSSSSYEVPRTRVDPGRGLLHSPDRWVAAPTAGDPHNSCEGVELVESPKRYYTSAVKTRSDNATGECTGSVAEDSKAQRQPAGSRPDALTAFIPWSI